MTNHYENCKNTVIEDIIAHLEDVDILTLYGVRRMLEECKALTLKEYIDKWWGKYSEGFRKDLEHEVRRMYLKTKPLCGSIIEPADESNLIECMWDITINGESPDVWVMEQGTVFNYTDIAKIIFDIYIGKVVFK